MAVGAGDLDTIFDSGDFNVNVTFDLSPSDLVIPGIFTDASDRTLMFGQIEVEAQRPSVMVQTSDLTAAVLPGVNVTVAGVSGTFRTEKIEKTGAGLSVVYLKTQ